MQKNDAGRILVAAVAHKERGAFCVDVLFSKSFEHQGLKALDLRRDVQAVPERQTTLLDWG